MIFLDETILDPSALVPVADYAPTVYVDLKYAGTDNFMGQAVYDFHEPMLRRAPPSGWPGPRSCCWPKAIP